MLATGRIKLQRPTDETPLFLLEAPAVEGYVIGRSDDATSYVPDIDLLNHGAREQGVSRKHAVLVRYRGDVHVVDLNSVNGSYLNDERLAADTPYPINIGDKLTLGNLELLVFQVE